MEDLKTQASQYWFGLSQRERRLASIGGVALIIWMMFFVVVKPVMQAEQAALNHLVSSKSLYSQVEKVAGEISELRAAGVTASGVSGNQPLDTLISRSSSAEKIPVTGMNQQNKSLQIRVDDVSFVQLMKWFKKLEMQGIAVDSMQLEQTDKPGMVRVVQLRVSRIGDAR